MPQVFEGWSYLAALGVTRHPELRAAALGMLRATSAALAADGRALLAAVSPLVPAPGRPAQLTAADVEELIPLVEGLSGAPAGWSLPTLAVRAEAVCVPVRVAHGSPLVCYHAHSDAMQIAICV
jgi:hypothetical protein